MVTPDQVIEGQRRIVVGAGWQGLAGKFLQTVLEKAEKVSAGDGICVVRGFEPIRLYSTLEEVGL